MIRIRRADSQDAAAIARLHTAGWRDTYSNVLSSDFLKNAAQEEHRIHWQAVFSKSENNKVVFVAEETGGEIVGFICIKLRDDPRWGAYIDSLHISSTLRGKGVGKALLRHGAEWIHSIDAQSPLYLWVFKDNHRATAFYQKLGGEIVEQTQSDIPSANKAPVFRISWENARLLMVGADCANLRG